MGWCDLISSIILYFFLVHAFNSSYFKEFRGPLETTVPLFVCVNEICGFGGRELRSELQEHCAGDRAHVLLGNTQLLFFVLQMIELVFRLSKMARHTRPIGGTV